MKTKIGFVHLAPKLWQWEILLLGRHAVSLYRQGRRAGLSFEWKRFD